jgi:hypothetical protein
VPDLNGANAAGRGAKSGNKLHIILTAALVLAAFPAWGKWLNVGESDRITFYADPSSAKKNGHLRRFLELMDLKERDLDGELSLRALVEYDCNEGRARTLSMSAYTGPMGTGMTLFNISDPGDWSTPLPGTTGDTLLRSVCAP